MSARVGWATYAHIPGLLAHPDAEIVAVSRRSPDKLASVAQRYSIPRTFTDYREMIHLKPMTMKTEEARELVRLADSKGLEIVSAASGRREKV